MTPKQEFQARWKMLVGCMLGIAIGVHSLPYYTAGIFLVPLTAEFGWTRTQASFAPTILMIVLGLAAPFAGALIDRVGERRAALTSLAFVGGGFICLSFQSGEIGLYLGIFAAMALFGAGASTITFSRLIVRSFPSARGTALGIGMIGTGVASSLATLLLVPFIAASGWRSGYLALAVVVLAGAVLILLLTRETSVQETEIAEPQFGLPVGEVVRSTTFWKLAAAFLFVALASSGLLVHFVPLLLDVKLPPARAAALASLVGIFLIVGRLAAGVLFDVAFAPRVAAILMAASAAGLAGLALGGADFAIVGALAIGLSFGAEMDLVGYLCARYFGTRHYGRIYGLLYTVVLAGTSLSPLLYGTLRDHSGSYNSALFISAGMLAASVIVFLTMPGFAREKLAAPL